MDVGGLEPPTPCLQNTLTLSDTVAHLGRRLAYVQRDRLESEPVVVSFGGQLVGPATDSLRAHFAMPVMWAHTPVTCTPASIKVHWRLTVSTAVVTQLVTHLARSALGWLDRSPRAFAR